MISVLWALGRIFYALWAITQCVFTVFAICHSAGFSYAPCNEIKMERKYLFTVVYTDNIA
jgi:hypothetical protein